MSSYTQTSVPTKNNAHQTNLLCFQLTLRGKSSYMALKEKKDKRLWVGGAGGRVVISETTKQRNGTHTQRTGHKKMRRMFVDSGSSVCRVDSWDSGSFSVISTVFHLLSFVYFIYLFFKLLFIYLNGYIIWDQSAIRQINFYLFLSYTIYLSPYISFACVDGVWVGLCHACFHDKASRLGQTDRHTYNQH